jgi:hypothetical protein
LDSIPFTEIEEIVSPSNHKLKSELEQSENRDNLDGPSSAAVQTISSGTQNSSRQYLMRSSSFARRHHIIDVGQPHEDLPVVHVRTFSGGSNAGRSYCLEMDMIDRQNIVTQWTNYSRAAKKRKSNELKSFQKAARRLYHSAPFQFVASTLIMMVRNCSHVEISEIRHEAHTSFAEFCLHCHRGAAQQKPGGCE